MCKVILNRSYPKKINIILFLSYSPKSGFLFGTQYIS